MSFISTCVDDNPRWSIQQRIIESVFTQKEVYVKSGHGIGKTATAADVILTFLFAYYPAMVITTAPSWPQVEKLLWAELNKKAKNMKLKQTGLKIFKTKLEFDEKWFAIGISPKIEIEDAGKRFTGFHSENFLVVFDEGPSVPSVLWEMRKTLMTSANSHFLAIGNPIGEGPFKRGYENTNNCRIDMSIFESPNFKTNGVISVDDLVKLSEMDKEKRDKLYLSFVLPMPFLTTPQWAVDRLIEWSLDSPMFEARVLGIFPRKTTDTVISYSECEQAKDIEPNYKHDSVIGVDVARFGSDFTVIYGYEKGKRIIKERWQGQDLVKTANAIKAIVKQYKIRIIVCDDTGLGGGVTDQLTHWIETINELVELIPINFAQSANNSDIYNGIVTEMYYNARDLIRDKNIEMIDDGDLFSDISSRKYEFDNKGLYKIESKDKFKRRLGRSPDDGDAFILACYGMTRPKGGEVYIGGSDFEED